MPNSKTKIPTGDSKEDVYIRRAIIVERLAPLIGKSVPCGAFHGKKAKIEFDSVDETATHAAKRYESTLAALRIEEALKIAVSIKKDKPKSKKQKKMGFVKIHELEASLDNLGSVKIIVGERKNKMIVHYCITKKKNN